MGEKFIDVHTHILPGVDDGSRNMEESLAMLRQAERENIGSVILTPHQKPDRHCVSPDGMAKRIQELRNAAAREGINVRIYPGGELFYRHSLTQELQDGRVATLADSRYVLVEFFPQEQYEYIRNGIYSLLAEGYLPVVAHVERYIQVHESRERPEELLDMGCYFQVNAGSLTGSFGFGMKRTAWKLVKRQQVHFVGTDAHRADGSRTPQLLRCAKLLEKKCGAGCAAKLLYRNAEMIIHNKEL